MYITLTESKLEHLRNTVSTNLNLRVLYPVDPGRFSFPQILITISLSFLMCSYYVFIVENDSLLGLNPPCSSPLSFHVNYLVLPVILLTASLPEVFRYKVRKEKCIYF